jgi:DNA (cytosine-5)-methyltransferase 1
MLVECKSGREVAELDILTRMLQPHDLAAAHSFPKSYQFTGSKEAQTKQIGNSVPVELAAAHAAMLM